MTDDVQRSLGRIEGKLDSLLDRLDAHTADDAENFKEIRAAVSVIQNKVQFWSGGIALLVSGVTLGASEILGRLFR